MRRWLLLPLFILFVTPIISHGVQAATAPADAIKYRMKVMEGLAAHFSAFLMLNMGRVDHPEYLQGHANALADLGAQGKDLFPVGSDAGKTDALPLIWQTGEQEQFNALVLKLQTSSAQLRDAVAAKDQVGTKVALKTLGDSCKGCHDRYRKPDDGAQHAH